MQRETRMLALPGGARSPPRSAQPSPSWPRTVCDVVERLEVPEADRLVGGARRQEELVRVELEGRHGAAVWGELAEELPGLEVPDLRRFAGGRADGVVGMVSGVVFGPRQGQMEEAEASIFDRERMRGERRWREERLVGPQGARLDAAVLPPRGDPPAVGAERHPGHPARVALVGVDAPLAADVPDLDVRVQGARSEEIP